MRRKKHDAEACPGIICKGECMGVEPGTFCVNCGPGVSVDEDGCCFVCGCDATGPWADRVVTLIDELRETVENDDEGGWCATYASEVLKLIEPAVPAASPT